MLAGRLGDRLSEAVKQQLPVGQTRQAIVMDQALELAFHPFAFHGKADRTDQGIGVQGFHDDIVLGPKGQGLDGGIFVVAGAANDQRDIGKQFADRTDGFRIVVFRPVEVEYHGIVFGLPRVPGGLRRLRHAVDPIHVELAPPRRIEKSLEMMGVRALTGYQHQAQTPDSRNRLREPRVGLFDEPLCYVRRHLYCPTFFTSCHFW